MQESQMPAAEAAERSSYEFAFHVLPTVAEGEVPAVFDTIKGIITNMGGSILDEEAPARFDLAYEIVKYLEGRNRTFTSAYFGWVRFTATPDKVAGIGEELAAVKQLLRHLTIKLTKAEESHAFRFHESLAARVTTIEEVPADAEVVAEEVEVIAEDVDGVEGEDKV